MKFYKLCFPLVMAASFPACRTTYRRSKMMKETSLSNLCVSARSGTGRFTWEMVVTSQRGQQHADDATEHQGASVEVLLKPFDEASDWTFPCFKDSPRSTRSLRL
ncbi:unnamed protein product [Pleuronectes platessa]|uniref:Uncharacterized protein n=1 Tax=Pleuronectes platessa TaxID=8262 RepID=A0A9N7UEH8_PLEPL|nr:unnamed protein product [Pleuronectes platessa]